jgi:hypothetical protein
MKRSVEMFLINIYHLIGIDRPANHEQILDFVYDDVSQCADPDNWHSGDVSIAFRRYLEKDYVT